MKVIGVMADTHLPSRCRQLPKELLTAMEDVDLIIHAGDIEEQSVLATLEKYRPTLAVLGNHDRKGNLKNKLPLSRLIRLNGYRIGVVHGDRKAAASKIIIDRVRDCFYPQIPDLIIYGHTHEPMVFSDGQCVLVNPGSAVQARRFERCSFAKVYLGKVMDVLLHFYTPGSSNPPIISRYTFHQGARTLVRKRLSTKRKRV